MPEKATLERARKAKRNGRAPSTQAGAFVREEIHHVREGKHGAEECMSQSVIVVDEDAPLDEVIATMEKHRIRRVPVVDDGGCCVGIIAQADLARTGPEHKVAELVREVSQETAS